MSLNLSKKFVHSLFLIALLTFCGSTETFGQNSDLQMAQYYYENSDFEKAKLYYEKLYSHSSTQEVYTQYVNTLVELGELDEAIKITKKKIKTEKFGSFYAIKLGYLYEQQADDKKVKSYYKDLINELTKKNTVNEFVILANEFVRVQKYEYAIQVFERCDNVHSNSNHKISIANLHGMLGNYEQMIDTYLDQLTLSSAELVRIKMLLPRSINFTEDKAVVDILKKQTLRKIQKQPENESLYDLLIWIYQQSNDFETAFIHVKALDKRTKQQGEKIYEFGQMCASNKNYELAIASFDYCIQQYDSYLFSHIASKQAILEALQSKIFANASYKKEDLINLKNRYLSTLNSTNDLEDKFPLIKGLAYLEGFYIHNIDTAEILYKQLLSFPSISPSQFGEVKIDLADIYMLKNEIWDASLLYMQVEKKFKHDILGSKAKFKNAKLYYYTGDFEWSQNQLDGLKASTSKLISNDAIDLSLLITDNYNMDTTPVNMKQFARGDLFIFQNQFQEALLVFDSILSRNPSHSLADEIEFKKYEIAFKKQEFLSAKKHLEHIINEYKEGILGDNALFKLAELQENQLNQPEEAMKNYEKLLFDYPGSLFVVEARKRFRDYQTKYPDKANSLKTIVK